MKIDSQKTAIPIAKRKDPPGQEVENMFQEAAAVCPRISALIYGGPGVGKTYLSVQFPSPALIDTEHGSHFYGGKNKFSVLHVSSFHGALDAVEWLANNPHNFKTLVIDSATPLWESVQKYYTDVFLKRNFSSKGHKTDFYQLQPGDWSHIKGAWKTLWRRVTSLGMNVIVTCREKTLFKETGFMIPAGETYDCEKNLGYWFDMIIHLTKTKKGEHKAVAIKDRSNKLPKGEFPISYSIFEGIFGQDNLNGQANPKKMASKDQIEKLEELTKELDIIAIKKNLAKYDAENFSELSAEKADLIISKLTT